MLVQELVKYEGLSRLVDLYDVVSGVRQSVPVDPHQNNLGAKQVIVASIGNVLLDLADQERDLLVLQRVFENEIEFILLVHLHRIELGLFIPRTLLLGSLSSLGLGH